MNYIAKKADLRQSCQIFFKFKGNGTEWLDLDLPSPYFLKHIKGGYIIGWCIIGYFSKYITELQSRILQNFDNSCLLDYTPTLNSNTHIFDRKSKLKEFKGLKPLKITHKKNSSIFYKDESFWEIKLETERIIRNGAMPTFNQILEYAYTTFPMKCKSTLRAKCRSVLNWYIERDYKTGRANTKYKDLEDYWEKSRMTRIQNLKKIHKGKEENSQKMVLNCITGLFNEEFKKKNGTWNAVSISKNTNLNVKTVRKVLKNIQEDNILA